MKPRGWSRFFLLAIACFVFPRLLRLTPRAPPKPWKTECASDLLRHAHKNPNHSILVKTIGTRSNRDGIGAEVKVVSGNLTQYDTVRSGGSYLSSSDLRLHFGVGTRAGIDRLEVRWLGGQVEVVQSPPVDHILIL